MTDNFLPKFHPVVTHGGKNTMQCLVRDKSVRATPEECVRQRVLHWLIHNKGWSRENLRLEKSYKWVSDPARKRIRTDIELLVDGEVIVVVECKRKRGNVRLDESVGRQATEYAIKARAEWIWITNGEDHSFFRKKDSKKKGPKWLPSDSLTPLNVLFRAPDTKLRFPVSARPNARYWQAFGDPQFLDQRGNYDRRLVLAIHRMLFDVSRKLPYSHGGLHILEDRGSAWHNFSNRSGRGYFTRYADFIAATEGRVEAVSVAVNRWGRGDDLRLCVGVRKPNRTHHALQLDMDQCQRVRGEKSWRIYHDGKMSEVRMAVVMKAVREAQAGQWIESCHGGRERLFLGVLPDAGLATWANSRKLLANLIHYALIRTNLREAHKSRSRLNRQSQSAIRLSGRVALQCGPVSRKPLGEFRPLA